MSESIYQVMARINKAAADLSGNAARGAQDQYTVKAITLLTEAVLLLVRIIADKGES